MDSTSRNILVPWDFSTSTKYALEHANVLAKMMSLNISLLHVIVNPKDDGNCQEKLQEVATENEKNSGVPTKVLIQSGDVRKTINEFASLPDTAFVVLKTDGIKGMQKYTGSNAMKSMAKGKAPYLVVQDSPKATGIKQIVYPIDFRSENKELLSLIINLLKIYNNPKIYLLKSYTNDKAFKKNISNTVNFAKTLFDSKNIDYEIVQAKEKVEYSQSVNEFAKSVDADLIIVQLQRNMTLTKFLFGIKEQNVVANPYKIPVFCLNQKEVRVYAGFH